MANYTEDRYYYDRASHPALNIPEEKYRDMAGHVQKVFNWCFLGLFLAAVAAGALTFLANVNLGLALMGAIGATIAYIILAIILNVRRYRIYRSSASTTAIIFILFTLATGGMLFTLVSQVSLLAIVVSLGVTTAMFLALVCYGLATKRDLSSWGPLLTFGLLFIIIGGILNWLVIGSLGLEFVITIVAIVIFLGCIAYDMQRIKWLYGQSLDDTGFETEITRNFVIFGAMDMFLNFVNLFIRILRIVSAIMSHR